MDMYKEIILENYRNPQNKGKLLKPDIVMEESNPLCGDNIEIYLKIENEMIKNVSFQGKGCALSIATISLLSEEIKNKKLKEIKKMNLEDINKLLGIDVNPGRIKCVLLPLTTIKKAIAEYEKKVKK